ncbi:MAG: MFS transporter [Ruminococcaceae bacterium]|nr:MFS transporter [Oscillospiraceae bacterium]
MRKLDKKWKIVLYGCSGLGLNMLNIIIGTHLCNGLLAEGFSENSEFWTYSNRTLVVVGIWSVMSLLVKILDGLIDIPLSSFTDNLRTRWGRRRPSILLGYIPLLISYVLFLFPLESEATILNTIWFVVLLGIFYCAYTLTMITWYATFAEIVEDENDRMFLSNVKSVCDVAYFSLNFALVPAFVSMGINIRHVALIFLPLALTMLIPLFMIKEPSTKDGIITGQGEVLQERVSFVKSLVFAFKNKRFIYWLCIAAVMNMGLQLFLGGISVFFSNVGDGLNMTFVMASAFVPVPFTLILYNRVVKKKGLKFAYQYILLVFSVGMSLMIFCPLLPKTLQLPYAIMCAVIVSFSIGAFFSITYTIPSQLAAEENERSGVCASSMYFAVQGLFEAISAGIATQVVLVFIRTFRAGGAESGPLVKFLPLIVAGFCMVAFLMAFLLPESIAKLGKEKVSNIK